MMFIRFSCNMNVILTVILVLFSLALSNRNSPYLHPFLWHTAVLDTCKGAGLAPKVVLMAVVTYFTFGYMMFVVCGNIFLFLLLKTIDKP